MKSFLEVFNMTEIELLLEDVEKLRKALHELIAKKGSGLEDPEILAASQSLNAAITEYNKMISKEE